MNIKNLNNEAFIRTFEASIAGVMLVLLFGYLLSSHSANHYISNLNLEFYGYTALYNSNLCQSDFEINNISNLYSKLNIPPIIKYGIKIYKDGNLYYSDVNWNGETVCKNYVFYNNRTVEIYKLKLIMQWK